MSFETILEANERVIYKSDLSEKLDKGVGLTDYEETLVAIEEKFGDGLLDTKQLALKAGRGDDGPRKTENITRKVLRRFYKLYGGERVRTLKKRDFDPVAIYVYVLKITDEGKIVADGYELDDGGSVISCSGMKDKVSELLADLDTDSPLNTPETRGFQKVVWNKISYLVFVIDSNSWHFAEDYKLVVQDHKLTKADPLHFEGFTDDTCVNFLDNHCFYDGEGSTISGKEVFYCHNYLIDQNGKPLGKGVVHDYKFDLWFRVNVEGLPAGSDLTIIIDPTGQNQGPP